MRFTLICAVTWALAAAAIPAAEPPAAPAFSKKPVASRDGDKVKIDFATDRETDVAVYIENARGEVVRHLVAGALGRNPPEPLKAGSLAQSVEWDGKDDDGKPATGGPFTVRIGLGLQASWGGTAFSDKTGPNHLTNVWGLAAGADGRVFVLSEANAGLYHESGTIHVFRRDGAYERTVKPFPANLPPERLAAARAFVLPDGGLTPIIKHLQSTDFYTGGYSETRKGNSGLQGQHPAVTPQGHLLFAVAGGGMAPHLAAIDGDGGIPNPSYAGPALLPGDVGWSNPFMAVSADGKCVYIAGLGGPKKNDNGLVRVPNNPAVYRAGLPERGPAQVFFGEAGKAGNDEKHLDHPRGLALDGKGRLFVADNRNNRVVVLKEADGSFAGSFAVPSPGWLGVHPGTGAVYVHSGEVLVSQAGSEKAGFVLKFVPSGGPGSDGWKEAGRIKLAPVTAGHHSHSVYQSFALDVSADPAVLWVGRGTIWPQPKPLLRCEDRGGSFSDWVPAAVYESPALSKLSTDPLRREVACVNGNSLLILNESSGKMTKLPGAYEGNCTYRLALNGNVYRMGCGGGGAGPDSIFQVDRAGKRIAFPAADPKFKGCLGNRPSGTTAWERDLGVDRQGNLYVMNRGAQYHGLHKVDKYAPDGKPLETILWSVTDGLVGPKIDLKGNIYIADAVKPVGKKWPEVFDGRLPKGGAHGGPEHWYDWMYGSVIKFSPKGGAFWVGDGKGSWTPAYAPWKDAGPSQFPEEPKIDPSLAKEPAGYWRGDGGQPTVQGALWRHFGFARVEDMHSVGGEHCHCVGTDFDVDDFGRVFFPDQGRFQVTVLDTNGNVVRHIGGYGNQDHCGPDSYVLDPKQKFCRPRNADDPKDLKSPFAEPEIAFNWMCGMAVTDRHLYVADNNNYRVLRIRLKYAAAETVAVP